MGPKWGLAMGAFMYVMYALGNRFQVCVCVCVHVIMCVDVIMCVCMCMHVYVWMDVIMCV